MIAPTRYRWRYNVRGRRLEVPVEGGEVKAAAGPEMDSDADVKMLQELARWLERNWEFGLELADLERIGALRTPPEWSYVREALQRVSGGAHVDAEDRDVVRQYGEMLRSRQEDLDGVLLWASVASLGSEAKAGRLGDGLKALPESASLDPDRLRDDLPQLRELEPISRALLTEGEVADWLDGILRRHRTIEEVVRIGEWKDLQRAAWDRWQDRFTTYLGHGRTQFPVEAGDVLLAARGSPPATFLRNDLKKMTLREWSEALLVSVAGEGAPRWLAVPCLYALVFRDIALNLAFTIAESKKWTSYLGGFSGDYGARILVIGSSLASPSYDWLPAKSVGSFWIRRDRFDALNAFYKLPFTWAFESILVEAPASGNRLEAAVQLHPSDSLGKLKPLLTGEARYAYFGFSPLPGGVTPSVPYIYEPLSLDDAISKLNTMVPSSHQPTGIPTEKK